MREPVSEFAMVLHCNRQRHTIAAALCRHQSQTLLRLLRVIELRYAGTKLPVVGLGGAGFALPISDQSPGLPGIVGVQSLKLGPRPEALLCQGLEEACGS